VAAAYARAEKADSTRRAYAGDFVLFRAWCTERSANPLPASPEAVAAYLAFEAARSKPSTINRRLAAIRYAHRLSGLPTPTADERVRAVMRGKEGSFAARWLAYALHCQRFADVLARIHA
jgi:site-specific recombinase XerD